MITASDIIIGKVSAGCIDVKKLPLESMLNGAALVRLVYYTPSELVALSPPCNNGIVKDTGSHHHCHCDIEASCDKN